MTYIRGIIEDYRNDRNIHAVALNGGEHLYMVEEAIKRIAADEKRFDTIYRIRAIFLDADRRGQDPDRDAQCDDLLERHKFLVVWQRPTFEGLLLHHFPGYERANPPHADAARHQLTNVWPAYEKGMSSHQLRSRLSISGLRVARTVETELAAFLIAVGLPPSE